MKVKNCCFKHHDYLPKNWVDDGEEGGCNNSIGEKLQNCEKRKEHIMVVLTNNNKNSKTHVPPNHQLRDFLHVLERDWLSSYLTNLKKVTFNKSGQITLIPKPKWSKHFEGIPLLFTNIWGNSQPAVWSRWNLPRQIPNLTNLSILDMWKISRRFIYKFTG